MPRSGNRMGICRKQQRTLQLAVIAQGRQIVSVNKDARLLRAVVNLELGSSPTIHVIGQTAWLDIQ